MRRFWTAIAALGAIGCNQVDADSNASKDIERRVAKFYTETAINQSVQIHTVSQNESIVAFCVLSAYEDRVIGAGVITEKVNEELEKIKLMGTEEYWHLIVITDNKVRIARFATTELPLISPRPAFDGGNCKTTTSIKLIKQPPIHASPKLYRLLESKSVINIQGGKSHGYNKYGQSK
jgi:hypothetical protein